MPGNPTTREEIVANADYHSRLLQSCSEVEYAPPALRQHDSYIKDLEGQLAGSDKKVEDLSKITKKERKEHEKLRDSTARRFAAKLSGKLEKFEANQMKEEKEYVDALQNEMVERDQNAVIQQLLTEARTVREDLVEKSKKSQSLKAELDSLYSRIFDGPSEYYAFHEKIRRSGAQVLLATNKLKEERHAAVQRAEFAGQQVEGTAQRLESTRKELFQLRKALFESVATNAPRPPSYDKVTATPPAVPPKDSPPAFPSPSLAPIPSAGSTSLNQTYPPPPFPPPNMAPPAGATSNPHSETPSSPSGRQWGSRE
ncbi:hypothetical protein H1R20_g3864, partial [Candolleomyces eurysporus]